MRIRNLKNTDEILNKSKYLIKKPKRYKGKFKTLFGNENPIHIEIGTGKGKFIYENAFQNPNINYIGIEKYSSVIARAINLIEDKNLENLYLIREDAIYLEEIFDKEISTIYLNFSDPWLKKRYHKRRLTSDVFLTIYDKLFKDTKKIVMKTDNIELFEYSIESLKQHGYEIISQSYDLEKLNIKNIKTEYETKFTKLGLKINYLVAIKK